VVEIAGAPDEIRTLDAQIRILMCRSIKRAGAKTAGAARGGPRLSRPHAIQMPASGLCPVCTAMQSAVVANITGKPLIMLARPERLELPTLGFEDLRHSFASVGAGSGMGLPLLGRLLGHKQPVATQKYAHLDAAPLRKAANSIDAVMKGGQESGAWP
jgi:hypothetical protein